MSNCGIINGAKLGSGPDMVGWFWLHAEAIMTRLENSCFSSLLALTQVMDVALYLASVLFVCLVTGSSMEPVMLGWSFLRYKILLPALPLEVDFFLLHRRITLGLVRPFHVSYTWVFYTQWSSSQQPLLVHCNWSLAPCSGVALSLSWVWPRSSSTTVPVASIPSTRKLLYVIRAYSINRSSQSHIF